MRRYESWVVGVAGSLGLHLLGGLVGFALWHRPARALTPKSLEVAPLELVRLKVLDRHALGEPTAAPSRTPETSPPAGPTTRTLETSTPRALAAPTTRTPEGPETPRAQPTSDEAVVRAEPSDALSGLGEADERDERPFDATSVVEAAGAGAVGGAPNGGTVGADGAASPARPTGPSADTVAMVHGLLSRVARDCYPERARRFRQTARVPLRFCVAADGQPRDVAVEPSGVGVLDEAARSCVVANAAPFPEVARGACFTGVVEFREER